MTRISALYLFYWLCSNSYYILLWSEVSLWNLVRFWMSVHLQFKTFCLFNLRVSLWWRPMLALFCAVWFGKFQNLKVRISSVDMRHIFVIKNLCTSVNKIKGYLWQRRTNLTPYWIYSFISKPYALLPVLSHEVSAPFVKECCLWPEIYRVAQSQGTASYACPLKHNTFPFT